MIKQYFLRRVLSFDLYFFSKLSIYLIHLVGINDCGLPFKIL